MGWTHSGDFLPTLFHGEHPRRLLKRTACTPLPRMSLLQPTLLLCTMLRPTSSPPPAPTSCVFIPTFPTPPCPFPSPNPPPPPTASSHPLHMSRPAPCSCNIGSSMCGPDLTTTHHAHCPPALLFRPASPPSPVRTQRCSLPQTLKWHFSSICGLNLATTHHTHGPPVHMFRPLPSPSSKLPTCPVLRVCSGQRTLHLLSGPSCVLHSRPEQDTEPVFVVRASPPLTTPIALLLTCSGQRPLHLLSGPSGVLHSGRRLERDA